MEGTMQGLSNSMGKLAKDQSGGFDDLRKLILMQNARTPFDAGSVPNVHSNVRASSKEKSGDDDSDATFVGGSDGAEPNGTGKNLKITRDQHINFAKSLEINQTTTWAKIFPTTNPELVEMP
eukprot:5156808-Karenia_brevis.AAC.1